MWPFHNRSSVKRWPLCTASRSHCLWVTVFRLATNIVFSKSLVNYNIASKTKQKVEKQNTFSLHYTISYEKRIRMVQRQMYSQSFGINCNWIAGAIKVHSPTQNLLMFIQDFLTPHFFQKVKKHFSVSGVTWGENRRGGGGGGWRSLAPPWWVKVSLLAWWLVHSADATWSLSWGSHLPGCSCRARFTSVFWVLCDWIHNVFSSIPTCYSTCHQCPKDQFGWR